MMMMFLKKLGVILYKNLLLRGTQWFITTLEVILPIFFIWLLCKFSPSFDCVNVDEANGTIESGERSSYSDSWCSSGIRIRYYPNNTATTEALEKMNRTCGGGLLLHSETSEKSLLLNLKKDRHIGIVFPDGLKPLKGRTNGSTVKNAVLSYVIRVHASKLPTTKQLFPEKLGDESLTHININKGHRDKYASSRFLSIQRTLDKVLIEMITGQQNPNFKVSFEILDKYIPHKYSEAERKKSPPAWNEEAEKVDLAYLYRGAEFVVLVIPIMLSFSVLFTIPTITRNVVSEKQTGIGELLKSAGVSGGIQWLGWMINSLVPMLFAMSICTLLLFTRLGDVKSNGSSFYCVPHAVLVYSDWTLVWFILVLHSLSTIAMCFFICSVVKKPTIATIIAVIISVLSTFMYLLPGNKIIMSIFPNCALSFAYYLIERSDRTILDESEKPFGAQWNWELFNYYFEHESSTFAFPLRRMHDISDVNMLQIMGMMVGDVVLYSLFALYFENVLPNEYGIRRPWYIFNFPEYFRIIKNKLKMRPKQVSPEAQMVELDPVDAGKDDKVTDTAESKNSAIETSGAGSKSQQSGDLSFEPEAARDTPVGIELQNIYKNFGIKRAVNGVSLKMYEGDIFALLGHNGAGKTTLISVLTGFFSPTKGTAIVNGHDIRNNMGNARNHLGLCPQHNMLFDNISVIKQLVIFGMLRGMNCREAKREAKSLLLSMNLIEKEHTSAKKLSGGQKRKLSLAMALIGGTKVVVLDEPTSGMDPQARREIWDLLLELRQGGRRPGDRIGIMAAGKVQCCGTTAFLKKYYGTGFTLKLTLRQQSQGPSNTSMSSNANQHIVEGPEKSRSPASILALVRKHIPNASLKSDARSDANSSEVFLTLPSATATTAALTSMFTDLNGNKSSLGIHTIGLQQTTMDEVFLRVGELAEEEKGQTQKYEWNEDEFKKVPKLVGGRKIVTQFLALLRKKWIRMTRNLISLLFEVFLSMLLVLGVILILQKSATRSESNGYRSKRQDSSKQETESQPELPISLNSYESPISFYYCKNCTIEPHIKKVLGSSSTKYTPDPKGTSFKNSLALQGKSDLKKYKRQMIIAITSTSASSITAMFNAYPYHAAPLALNTAVNIALMAMQPSANNQIQVSNHPWVHSKDTSKRSASRRFFNPSDPQSRWGPFESDICKSNDEANSLPLSTMLLLAFMLFTSVFIIGPIEEKICNVKQLQLMTGLQPVTFWASHFAWDYFLYFILVMLTLVLIAVIELFCYQFLSTNHGAGVLFLILMCYGFSSISLAYLLSLRSSTTAGGYALVLLIHLFFGIIFGLPVYRLTSADPKNLGIFYYILFPLIVIAYCFPDIAALAASIKYINVAASNVACDHENSKDPSGYGKTYQPYLVWSSYADSYGPGSEPVKVSGVLQELFYLVLVGIIYVALLMVLEYKLIQRICGKGTPPPFPPNIYDDDVYQEAERLNMLIQSGQVGTECMVIQTLSKAFGGFAAVSQVNFGVHYGECFGLLGVNGAGKTTLFKMITGEILPSAGSIYGFGTTTVDNPKLFFSNIGYCPQFDAIFVKFTGKEMLELFGVLRGLPFEGAEMEATKWLQRFGLIESANVRCGKYSGGMKRRLSTAMAMIGDPALLLLDEPTSGVDPVSRHQFWGILEKIRDSGQSIILTSHSMDECEALCSRLGIMVNGQFQCFGGVQHLKTKFAQGYSLLVKLKPDLPFGTEEFEEKMTKFEKALNKQFQPCVLKDKHQNLLQYHLQNPSLSWETLFRALENFKKDFEDMIEDYSVNETSLEEVFLAFARMQYAERRVKVTACQQCCTCSC